jgi:hypothetical protein
MVQLPFPRFVIKQQRTTGHQHVVVSHVYPPIERLQSLFRTIDPNLLPSGEESKVPTSETTREELLLPEIEGLLGEWTRVDIVNAETKEVIVPAHRKISRAMLKSIISKIDKIDLPETNDDIAIIVLRKAKEKLKKGESHE